MWLPFGYEKYTSLNCMQRCVFLCYLLNICTSTSIKANAIIETATRAAKSKKINCNNKVSIICTTSILCRWQPHPAFPYFLYIKLYN